MPPVFRTSQSQRKEGDRAVKRVGYLMEKISDLDNLYLAYYKASRGKKGKSEVIHFGKNLDDNLQRLRKELLSGSCKVGHYRYFSIFDPKKRLICAASFPERVMHHAVMNVCHQYFERNLIGDTYATRIGKGTYEAIGKAMKAMSRYGYVAKLDVRKYFDSISHDVLKAKLRRLFKDAQLLALFDAIIESYSTKEGCGLPIGNLTSQYFANFYLSELDHRAKEELKIPVYLRYMDDILLFGNDKETLRRQTEILSQCVASLQLEFKPIIINKVEVGVSFLGYRLRRHRLTLNSRSRNRLKTKLRTYNDRHEAGYWTDSEYANHLQPLLAFAQKSYSKQLRNWMIRNTIQGRELQAQTACCAGAAGTTTQGTAAYRTGTTTTRATGTTTTGSACVFPSLRFQGMDVPEEVKQVPVPLPQFGTKRAASGHLTISASKAVDSVSKTLNVNYFHI